MRSGLTLKADFVGVDEINDLNPLQVAICKNVEAKDVFYTGDLDQAIFSFQGTSLAAIKSLPSDSTEVFETSYRVPSEIAETAEGIIKRASEYSPGKIKSVEQGGKVIRDPNFTNILHQLPTLGNALILARTNYILEKARLIALENKANIPLSDSEVHQAELGSLIKKPTPNFNFRDSTCLLGPWLPAGEYWQAGAKKRLREKMYTDIEGWMSWEELFTRYGTERLRKLFSGECFWMTDIGRFDPKKPIMRFMTMHGSKGLEEDVVVVIRDMGRRVYKNLHMNEDDEIRLFYVAATRARKTLFITDLQGKLSPYIA